MKVKNLTKTSQFNDWGIVELEQGEQVLLHIKSLANGYRRLGLHPFFFKNQLFSQLEEELKKNPLEIEGVLENGRFIEATIEKITRSASTWYTNTGKIKIPLLGGNLAEPVGEVKKGYASEHTPLFLHYDQLIVWDKKTRGFIDSVEHPIKEKIEKLIKSFAPASRGSGFIFEILREVGKYEKIQ